MRFCKAGSGVISMALWCGEATLGSSQCFPRCQCMMEASNLDNPQLQCLSRIKASKVIACLRAKSAGLALQAARAALDGGISVLEVTMTTPGATEVISCLVDEYPAAMIGAGTVLSLEDSKKAQDAGAKFLLSPVTLKDAVEFHAEGPVLFVPGAMTPTEVFTAHSHGAKIVKVYPTTIAGGVKHIESMTRMLQHIPVLASQGITLEMVDPYLKHGATAVVLSDAIFDSESMAKADVSKIKRQASLAAQFHLQASGSIPKNLATDSWHSVEEEVDFVAHMVDKGHQNRDMPCRQLTS